MNRILLVLGVAGTLLVRPSPEATGQPHRLSLTLNPFSVVLGFYGVEATRFAAAYSFASSASRVSAAAS